MAGSTDLSESLTQRVREAEKLDGEGKGSEAGVILDDVIRRYGDSADSSVQLIVARARVGRVYVSVGQRRDPFAAIKQLEAIGNSYADSSLTSLRAYMVDSLLSLPAFLARISVSDSPKVGWAYATALANLDRWYRSDINNEMQISLAHALHERASVLLVLGRERQAKRALGAIVARYASSSDEQARLLSTVAQQRIRLLSSISLPPFQYPGVLGMLSEEDQANFRSLANRGDAFGAATAIGATVLILGAVFIHWAATWERVVVFMAAVPFAGFAAWWFGARLWRELYESRFSFLAVRARESHRRALGILQAYRRMGQPFILALHNFAVSVSGSTLRYRDLVITAPGEPEGSTFEELLAKALEQFAPVLRIADTTDVPTWNEPCLYLTEKNWYGTVSQLVPEAALIVTYATFLTPGVERELSLLRDLDKAKSTVVVVGQPSDYGLLKDVTVRFGTPDFEAISNKSPQLSGFPRIVRQSDVKLDRLSSSRPFAGLLNDLRLPDDRLTWMQYLLAHQRPT